MASLHMQAREGLKRDRSGVVVVIRAEVQQLSQTMEINMNVKQQST